MCVCVECEGGGGHSAFLPASRSIFIPTRVCYLARPLSPVTVVTVARHLARSATLPELARATPTPPLLRAARLTARCVPLATASRLRGGAVDTLAESDRSSSLAQPLVRELPHARLWDLGERGSASQIRCKTRGPSAVTAGIGSL